MPLLKAVLCPQQGSFTCWIGLVIGHGACPLRNEQDARLLLSEQGVNSRIQRAFLPIPGDGLKAVAKATELLLEHMAVKAAAAAKASKRKTVKFGDVHQSGASSALSTQCSVDHASLFC